MIIDVNFNFIMRPLYTSDFKLKKNNTTKGVSHFKRGLSGDEYILQGELWCSAFPAFNKFLIQ